MTAWRLCETVSRGTLVQTPLASPREPDSGAFPLNLASRPVRHDNPERSGASPRGGRDHTSPAATRRDTTHKGASTEHTPRRCGGGKHMLGILVPSRGRPHNLQRLENAIAATVMGDYRIYTRLDNDDPTLPDYLTISGVNITIGPRIFYGPSLNEIAPLAVADGCTHLAMFGDDVVPETVGWDQMLINALGGKLGVAYGSDGLEQLHGADLPTHYVVPAKITERLGWFYLPTLRHLYGDNVARDIGQGLGNFQYVPDAKLTHLHRWNKTAPDDATYREANDKTKRRLDQAAYLEWRNGPGYLAAMESLTR